MLSIELQLPGVMGGAQLLEETPPEQAGEHAHRQEKTRFTGYPMGPIERQAATGDDAVDVRMMSHRRAPGMQHQAHPDAGPQMLWVGCDGAQALGCDLEQDGVDH